MRSNPAKGAGCRGHSGYAHAEGLAFRRQDFGDLADAENADRLVMQKLRREPAPLPFVLGADGAAKPPRQRQHSRERGFRNRRALDAAHIGDDHVVAQSRLVDEIVDAGAERLDPFESRSGGQHIAGQHRSESDKRIGLVDERPDLGMMVNQLDRDLRKALAQAVAILIANGLR
jgi:hypothetical protein